MTTAGDTQPLQPSATQKTFNGGPEGTLQQHLRMQTKVRAATWTEPKIYIFDAGHERRRKEQLERPFNRTPDQVEEEEYLMQELRKIESRKKEREKKKVQDLQKLITATDTNTEMTRVECKATKKKLPLKRETVCVLVISSCS
ncbi:hypothetical protein J4Q44_G00159040 [Coregonus suidteri]|uniref:DNA methyltransferase 1-associated 1 domain-containing protein n=1 Tax=Coregonus suidteri TaxID=861788 RepID=A0AAN8LLZ5_9TELE